MVGHSGATTGLRAFLWDVVGGMQDLNDLIDPGLSAVLTEAYAINASGQIVGMSQNYGGCLLRHAQFSASGAATPRPCRRR